MGKLLSLSSPYLWTLRCLREKACFPSRGPRGELHGVRNEEEPYQQDLKRLRNTSGGRWGAHQQKAAQDEIGGDDDENTRRRKYRITAKPASKEGPLGETNRSWHICWTTRIATPRCILEAYGLQYWASNWTFEHDTFGRERLTRFYRSSYRIPGHWPSPAL